jgi:hypothetical protein
MSVGETEEPRVAYHVFNTHQFRAFSTFCKIVIGQYRQIRDLNLGLKASILARASTRTCASSEVVHDYLCHYSHLGLSWLDDNTEQNHNTRSRGMLGTNLQTQVSKLEPYSDTQPCKSVQIDKKPNWASAKYPDFPTVSSNPSASATWWRIQAALSRNM